MTQNTTIDTMINEAKRKRFEIVYKDASGGDFFRS